MGDAPFVIIKNRPGAGTTKRSMRIARFWQHRETGTVVEIRAFRNVVPDNYYRVVFFDPTIKRELSLPFYKARPHPFQKPGSSVVEMEPGFLEQYEQYADQRSTRV
jgi:ribulose bisphosphate carboxylase small subunit